MIPNFWLICPILLLFPKSFPLYITSFYLINERFETLITKRRISFNEVTSYNGWKLKLTLDYASRGNSMDTYRIAGKKLPSSNAESTFGIVREV